MPELTLEIYERAVALAATDDRLAAGLRILDRLNQQLADIDRQREAVRASYQQQEESIASYVLTGDVKTA